MKVYTARPISGLTYDEVVNWIETIKDRLEEMGYEVLHPMTGKSYLRNEIEFKAHGYADNPPSTNHAIFERDKWMVSTCDIVFVDLIGTKSISIGCIMELAMGALLGKHTVVAMEEDNPHRHAFVLEAADIVYPNLVEALYYMEKLIHGSL